MTVFANDFYRTHQGEIFVSSQCLWHEHRLRDFMASVLINLGWHASDDTYRQWHRSHRTVILCLTDDFLVAGGNRSHLPQAWFAADTDVITDNHIVFDPNYSLWQLPSSYLGIYSYTPCHDSWLPTKDIGLSINRMDRQRIDILLALTKTLGGTQALLERSLINFNALDPNGHNESVQDLKDNWYRYLEEKYTVLPALAHDIASALPLRNHNVSVEQAHVSVWLNCVVETYAGDYTHAFSEKIFRALSTPAPWVLFGARGSVNYLSQIGFDVLDDVIDHDYDTNVLHDKIPRFMQSVFCNLEKVKHRGEALIRERCIKAAQHNQDLLAALRRKWPGDLAEWLPRVIDKLS